MRGTVRIADARFPRHFIRRRVVNEHCKLPRLSAAHANGGARYERLAVDLERIDSVRRVVRAAFDHDPFARIFEKERRQNGNFR